MEDCQVCVVLPAAGSGERMGLDIPKQYSVIAQKPVICYTVEAFLKISWIKKVIVVAASECLGLMTQILNQDLNAYKDKLLVTKGANTRHRSIALGLDTLKETGILPQIVILHDGVRPFFPEDVLAEVVVAAQKHGASGVVRPLVSTVISVDQDGFLECSLERNKFRASEMPQAFQYSVITNAYSKCSEYDLDYGTECLHLVQKYSGVKARLIESSADLWKITYKRDLYAAESVIKENQAVGIVGGKANIKFFNELKCCLQKKFYLVHEIEEDRKESYPNLVNVHKDRSICNIINNENESSCAEISCHPKSVIHIASSKLENKIDFLHLQRRARCTAKKIKAKGNLIYYIAVETIDMAPEVVKNVAETATSLLFSCNDNLSGQIFYF